MILHNFRTIKNIVVLKTESINTSNDNILNIKSQGNNKNYLLADGVSIAILANVYYKKCCFSSNFKVFSMPAMKNFSLEYLFMEISGSVR